MKDMRGDLFRQVHGKFLLKERPVQLRSGCKSLSPTPARGSIYLRKTLQVVVGGEKVGFFQGRGNGLGVGGYRRSIAGLLFDCPSGQPYSLVE